MDNFNQWPRPRSAEHWHELHATVAQGDEVLATLERRQEIEIMGGAIFAFGLESFGLIVWLESHRNPVWVSWEVAMTGGFFAAILSAAAIGGLLIIGSSRHPQVKARHLVISHWAPVHHPEPETILFLHTASESEMASWLDCPVSAQALAAIVQSDVPLIGRDAWHLNQLSQSLNANI